MTFDQNRPCSWLIATHAFLPLGTADRLYLGLRTIGTRASLIAVPLPGVGRKRFEARIEGEAEYVCSYTREARVSMWQEIQNVARLIQLLRIAKSGRRSQDVLVACDAVMFWEIAFACRVVRMRPKLLGVYFVDWSQHRISGRLGWVFKLLVSSAVRRADFVFAISEAARSAVERAGGLGAGSVRVVANLSLGPPQNASMAPRQRQVVYFGTLSEGHGISAILGVLKMMEDADIDVVIAGDGPSAGEVRRAARAHENLHYLGVLSNVEEIRRVLEESTVGLALYDPEWPQFEYIDSLKVKDYRANGLSVVTSLSQLVTDEAIHLVEFGDSRALGLLIRTLVDAHKPELAEGGLRVGERSDLGEVLAVHDALCPTCGRTCV